MHYPQVLLTVVLKVKVHSLFRVAMSVEGVDPLMAEEQELKGKPEEEAGATMDLAAEVEVSEDLVTWHSGEEYWEEFADPAYANQVEMMSYRAKQSTAEAPKLFMRVRVVYAP